VRQPAHRERVDAVAIGKSDRGAQNEVLAQRDALRRDRLSSFRYLVLPSSQNSRNGLDNLTTYGYLTTYDR